MWVFIIAVVHLGLPWLTGKVSKGCGGAVLSGKELKGTYDGYTSCPCILNPKECILAEFDFNAPPQPLETLPVNQGKPRWTTAMMKTHMMPKLYWSMMLNGNWEGPKYIRKALHLGMA
jgi:sulfide:quinone oxidoreductase